MLVVPVTQDTAADRLVVLMERMESFLENDNIRGESYRLIRDTLACLKELAGE